MLKPTRLYGKPLTILLVEDNPAHAELVIRSLQKHRVANRIIHVNDGMDVLKTIRTADEEALRRVPVVILTTSEADQDVTQASLCQQLRR